MANHQVLLVLEDVLPPVLASISEQYTRPLKYQVFGGSEELAGETFELELSGDAPPVRLAPFARLWDFAFAHANHQVYVCGGGDDDWADEFALCYDQLTNRWLDLAPMTKTRRHFAVAECDGALYLAGGDDNATMERLILSENEAWQPMPSMEAPRSDFTLTRIGRSLYAAGGAYNLDFEAFDTTLEEWRALPPMLHTRMTHAAVEIDETLFLIGGLSFDDDGADPQNTVDAFDTRAQRWRSCAPLPLPRAGHSAFVLDKKIYVLGGFGPDDDVTRDVQMYDSEKNEWLVTDDKLPFPACRHFCAPSPS